MLWTVRIVRNGQSYGATNSLVHNQEDPLVEFYDTRYDHTPDGQFVSRYYKSTLMANNRDGLCLQGGVPDWQIDGDALKNIKEWLNVQNDTPISYHLMVSEPGNRNNPSNVVVENMQQAYEIARDLKDDLKDFYVVKTYSNGLINVKPIYSFDL